jgi:hypothetical protein
MPRPRPEWAASRLCVPGRRWDGGVARGMFAREAQLNPGLLNRARWAMGLQSGGGARATGQDGQDPIAPSIPCSPSSTASPSAWFRSPGGSTPPPPPPCQDPSSYPCPLPSGTEPSRALQGVSAPCRDACFAGQELHASPARAPPAPRGERSRPTLTRGASAVAAVLGRGLGWQAVLLLDSCRLDLTIPNGNLHRRLLLATPHHPQRSLAPLATPHHRQRSLARAPRHT